MAGNFELKLRLPRIHFRVLLHAANMRHGTNGFTSLPKEGVLRVLFALKNPTASAEFEPANLRTKSQYATYRPPKPLKVSSFCYAIVFMFVWNKWCHLEVGETSLPFCFLWPAKRGGIDQQQLWCEYRQDQKTFEIFMVLHVYVKLNIVHYETYRTFIIWPKYWAERNLCGRSIERYVLLPEYCVQYVT